MEDRGRTRGLRLAFRATAGVCLLALASVAPSQDPPADLTGQRLKKALEVAEADLQKARAQLIAEVKKSIEGAKDATRKDRLTADLLLFEKDAFLPASAPAPALEYQHAYKRYATKVATSYEAAITAYTAADNAEAADKLDDAYAEACERSHLSEFRDLRCFTGFDEGANKSGAKWDGPFLALPAEGGKALRVASPLDQRLEDRYQLRLQVQRTSGDGPLRVLFPIPGCPDPRQLGAIVIDAAGGACSGIDGAGASSLQSTKRSQGAYALGEGKTATVVLTCRTNRIVAEVDGVEVADFDEMRSLRLSDDLTAKFASATNSFHVLPGEKTQFRVEAIGYRVLPEPGAGKAAVAAAARKGVEDMMPAGRVWTRDRDGGTVKVIHRNQSARTATLSFRIGRWHTHLTVKTNASGSSFELENARRLDDRVRLDNESGNGAASADRIELLVNWSNHRGNKQGFHKGKFIGER